MILLGRRSNAARMSSDGTRKTEIGSARRYLDPEQANQEFGWKVAVEKIPKPVMNPKNPAVDNQGRQLYYYVYICTKKLTAAG